MFYANVLCSLLPGFFIYKLDFFTTSLFFIFSSKQGWSKEVRFVLMKAAAYQAQLHGSNGSYVRKISARSSVLFLGVGVKPSHAFFLDKKFAISQGNLPCH